MPRKNPRWSTKPDEPITFGQLVGEFDKDSQFKLLGPKHKQKPPATPELAKAEARADKMIDKALEPGAKREAKIAAAVNRVLLDRMISRKAPMDGKKLALELAHYNMVHLGSTSTEVIERIAEYARDPSSLHHEWALKFMGERILPAKMAQEAILAAAGLREKKDGGQQKPVVVINIGEATPLTLQQERNAIDVIPE